MGNKVAAALEKASEEISLAQAMTIDNGPEFTGKVLYAWAYVHGIVLHFICQDKLVENGYIESFNGHLGD